ncbi:BREX-1 system adenine-specific DNA-methyltransferase PglX [uncultured Sphaerotilus sp.]|uniref:BREX-1 system adenine-specific DNA-methyltransferase PglX n=1 Tax=uncultured Sphaerotilus sp. TaxID=474984 RepID=UPI0030CA5009
MNKTSLKRYAPQARRDFIQAVTTRSQLLGIRLNLGRVEAEPCEVRGDVAMIGGRAWPAGVKGLREALVERMRREGYFSTLEAIAYTWFNRLAALRYMELHDYLGHGRRVLSNPEGGPPEVLAHAMELAESGELPGLRAELVRELKLANQDGELYRRVLVAQCNALHAAMPFLFEAIDDETELLLPDNLLHSDSVVAKLVGEIAEEDWAEVEVIGWLYQFFISEKKDEVIGKVVKSEDIPAATQLFTPNWIVQYLVQNSVGRLWLMANPSSGLAAEWPYYIAPAEQTPEVQAQLDALIQTRIAEDGDTLNPESLTVLDPACGSGHILVVAYDVLKAIYLERGYRLRDVPRLILEKNLYGLDIDGRAAQLAGFALLMKARADDRRLFSGEAPKLNVIALRESAGLPLDEFERHLGPHGVERATLRRLLNTFALTHTTGSLTRVSKELAKELKALTAGLSKALDSGDLYAHEAAKELLPLVMQTAMLAMQVDAVVANPPYMGGKGMNPALKEFAKSNFPDSKADLFAMFMERGFEWCKPTGLNNMITMQNWLFISSFESMRQMIVDRRSISTLIQIGYNSFPEMNSKVAQASATSIFFAKINYLAGRYINLNLAPESSDKNQIFLNRSPSMVHDVAQEKFKDISGTPIIYWIDDDLRKIFSDAPNLKSIADVKQGLATGDNDRFIRFWPEVEISRTGLGFGARENAKNSNRKWFPYSKGGSFRKWYGNREWLVNWENDGQEIRSLCDSNGNILSRYRAGDYYFKENITWTLISNTTTGFRYEPEGNIVSHKGPGIFGKKETILQSLALLNSCVAEEFLKILSPNIGFEIGQVGQIPILQAIEANIEPINISKNDWDAFEISWDFAKSPLLDFDQISQRISIEWEKWKISCVNRLQKIKAIEEENNKIFINAYSLQKYLSPDVTENQITLARADREKDCQRLVSYAIGCMMGRYSLDEPGLIYAHAGNEGFDPTRYTQFPADADGILPLTDTHWFPDDTAARVREFVRAVWGPDTLEENLAWLAESLGQKTGETPDETLRRYLADKFFKDHLQTYKKRPIYWLFSSGKQGAFQCLVYLHRYHAGTLARLRADYVLPLTSKLAARLDSLEADIRAASSTAARTRLTKQRDALRKQQHELLAYDEKLRHYADQRITLDLDDGVKVNYGKFGDLLAEVKAVTGGTGDD